MKSSPSIKEFCWDLEQALVPLKGQTFPNMEALYAQMDVLLSPIVDEHDLTHKEGAILANLTTVNNCAVMSFDIRHRTSGTSIVVDSVGLDDSYFRISWDLDEYLMDQDRDVLEADIRKLEREIEALTSELNLLEEEEREEREALQERIDELQDRVYEITSWIP